MSNVAGTSPDALEVRRFRWRIVPAFVLFLWGGSLGILGVASISLVLYSAVRNAWSGFATVDPTVNQWVPILLLSFSLMLVSGLLFIVAAYWCAVGRWRATVSAALLGVAAYACFLLVSPGAVPL